MKPSTREKIADLIARYPALAPCEDDMTRAVEAIVGSYAHGGKVLTCGNGGSAADSEHIVGELMKGFLKHRPLGEEMREALKKVAPERAEYIANGLQGALPAVSLIGALALNTAFANDQAPDLSMAQQVLGLGCRGDILLGISTSGNSKNVIYALDVAKAKGLTTIALTGETGGRLKAIADICICAPSRETYKIQEYHLPIYHMLCIAAENEFFDE